MRVCNIDISISIYTITTQLNMGYREGHGLGKHNQGRKEIVEISKQKGRRGLGVTYKEEGDLENAGWDFDKEKVVWP